MPSKRRAFTLLELVVVLAIMALVLTVTVPSVGALYDRQLVEQQARVLEQDLMWLRSEAQRSGKSTTFERKASGYTLTVETTEGSQVQRKTLVSGRVKLSANSLSGEITFAPRGTAFEKCTLTVRVGKQARTVIVSNLGRVRVGVPV